MFKAPFSFEGRSRRTEYGISLIIYTIIYLFLMGIIEASKGDAIFILIFLLPSFWFIFAQGAKRCHDLGNSGWYQLIPLYGFWLLFAEGELRNNQYGQNPKGNNNNFTTNNYTPIPPQNNKVFSYSGGHNATDNNTVNSNQQYTNANNSYDNLYNSNYNNGSSYSSNKEFQGNNPYAKN